MTNIDVLKKNASILIILSIILLSLVIYWPVQHDEFLNYDDNLYVTDNVLTQSALSYSQLVKIFSDLQTGNWHPLTMLSHMLDWQMYGKNAGGHHWTNVIIHILNTVLLFFFFKIATGAVGRSALVAALFAIHPINVESVAWIAERKNMLSTFFWLLTMLFYIWYVRRPNWKRYLPVLVSFILGLMSKAMLVTLPFVLLLMDYWPLCRMKINVFRQIPEDQSATNIKKQSISVLIAEKIPLFVLTTVAIYVAIYAQQSVKAIVSLDYLPLIYRVGNAVVSYAVYIRKLFFPVDLAVFYPFAPLAAWQIISAAVILIMVTVLVCMYICKYPYLAVGWFWYLGTLVPVIGLVQVGNQVMADRYAYVPFIGIFLMLAWGGFKILEAVSEKIIVMFIVIALLVVMVLSHQQVKHWENTFTLFSHALSVTENNFLAHSNVAGELLLRNKIDEAMIHCEKSLALKPYDYNTLVRVAWAYRMKGEINKAIESLRKAIQSRPDYIRAYDDLFNILLATGRTEEALKIYEQAVFTNQNNPEMHYHLANALAGLKRYSDAINQYQLVLILKPNNADIYSSIGKIYFEMDKMDDAIGYLRKAVELSPNHPYAHYYLSVAYKKRGLNKEAEYH